MLNINNYAFDLPKNLIAKQPATPRDSSRLFVYKTATDEIFFDRFYNISKYLPEKSLVVLNDTKVIPARIEAKKETGGKVVLLFLVNEVVKKGEIRAFSDRKLEVGDKVYITGKELTVSKRDEHIFSFIYDFGRKELIGTLTKKGKMPIPLYLKDTPLNKIELNKKYQTIFAKYEGSSAAPTASLHFTKRVFSRLQEKKIKKTFITLHVGLGTFAPLTAENMRAKRLHEEYYEIQEEAIGKLKESSPPARAGDRTIRQKNYIVAVGTTVARTLESAADVILRSDYGSNEVRISQVSSRSALRIGGQAISGSTDLFITPPYNFKLVDGLITNFHIPKSSLMMLVDAFLEYKKSKRRLVDLYKIAVQESFRFYSFGDVMLIL